MKDQSPMPGEDPRDAAGSLEKKPFLLPERASFPSGKKGQFKLDLKEIGAMVKKEQIQQKFDALMTGGAVPTGREGKDPALFYQYEPWNSQHKFRAECYASACVDQINENPSLEMLEKAVEILYDALNHASHSLVRQAGLIMLQESAYARDNLKLLPIDRRFGNWSERIPDPSP